MAIALVGHVILVLLLTMPRLMRTRAGQYLALPIGSLQLRSAEELHVLADRMIQSGKYEVVRPAVEDQQLTLLRRVNRMNSWRPLVTVSGSRIKYSTPNWPVFLLIALGACLPDAPMLATWLLASITAAMCWLGTLDESRRIGRFGCPNA